MVIDESADLDYAADMITKAAFGFSGQKCSACSRVVALDSVYDELLEKVVANTNKLSIGNPRMSQTTSDQSSTQQHSRKSRRTSTSQKKKGRIVAGGYGR